MKQFKTRFAGWDYPEEGFFSHTNVGDGGVPTPGAGKEICEEYVSQQGGIVTQWVDGWVVTLADSTRVVPEEEYV